MFLMINVSSITFESPHKMNINLRYVLSNENAQMPQKCFVEVEMSSELINAYLSNVSTIACTV